MRPPVTSRSVPQCGSRIDTVRRNASSYAPGRSTPSQSPARTTSSLDSSSDLVIRRRAKALCFGSLVIATTSLHTSSKASAPPDCPVCSSNNGMGISTISSPRRSSTSTGAPAARRNFVTSRSSRHAELQSRHAPAATANVMLETGKAGNAERERFTLASHPQSTFELLSWWHKDSKGSRLSSLQSAGQSRETSLAASKQASQPGSPATHLLSPAGTDGSVKGVAPDASGGSGARDGDDEGVGGGVAVQPDRKGKGRIHQLMKHPSLYLPVRVPRHTIVLCHGLYGFDVRGPFLGLEIHYWAATLDILRKKVGAEVLICGVPGTGSIQERAEALHKFLCSPEAGVQGKKLNFIGHSMGGLDVRHLITNIKPTPEQYTPVSLTTVNTPHRGSPFMDWCNANVGVGNDIIEKAIKEASSSPSPSDPEKDRRRAQELESEGISASPRPPYSLKTPLFVRQKIKDNANKQDAAAPASSSKENFADGTSSESKPGVTESRSPDAGDAEVKRKVEKKIEESAKSSSSGSLPFGLSTFTKALSSLTGSFSNYMLSVLDQPAYAMLSTKYMSAVFNPQTPDVPHVKYYSVAARVRKLAVWHPLWLPKLILDAAAESSSTGSDTDGSAEALGGAMQGNDGLVNVQSARWGEFLGVMEECDHWDLRGGGAPRWSRNLNPATGKPLPGKEQEAKKELKEAEEKKKKIEDSWIDINKLLSAFRPKKDASKPKTPSEDAKKEDTTRQSQTPDAMQPVLAFLDNYAQLAGNDSEVGPGLSRERSSAEPASAAKSSGSDQENLITEVVSWISDRLPERDEERRAAAERAADQFDAEEVRASLAGVHTALEQDAGEWTSAVITDAHLPTERGTRASDEAGATEDTDEALRTTSEPAGGLTLASAPTWDEVVSGPITMSAPAATVPHLLNSEPPASRDILPTSLPSSEKRETRLRRDAEWLEALGEGDKARELRRELQWHRAQYVDARTSREAIGMRGDETVEDHVRPNAPVRLRPPSDAERATDWDAPKRRKEVQEKEDLALDQRKDTSDSKKKEKKDDKKKKEDEVELERFWVALCRHLWEQGH